MEINPNGENAFATAEDVAMIAGKEYSPDDLARIEIILPLVSDALRQEAVKVGKDIDEMIQKDQSYAAVVKIVTVDIVTRFMRQSFDGDPMTQESQSALGYSWSGNYAIPGGGLSNAIMRNDLKRLGLRRQKKGTISLWGKSKE